MPKKYGDECDIVCHVKGMKLYTLPDGTETVLTTRQHACTPLNPDSKGLTKEKWDEEDLRTVCTMAKFNQKRNDPAWLERQRKKAMKEKK